MKYLLLVVTVASVSGLGQINRISFRPSECNNCGMTALGQVNMKICGGSPDLCCGVVNIANFENVNEGGVYDYAGEHELEDCFQYSLQRVNTIDQFRLTVYHEGSDGGQLDWVEVGTTDGSVVKCNLGRKSRRRLHGGWIFRTVITAQQYKIRS